MVLEEYGRIDHRVVVAGDKFMLQVRLVVEMNPAPAVRLILCVDAECLVLLQGSREIIHTIVVTSNTIDDVPRSIRIVVTSGIGCSIGIHWHVAFIHVKMAMKN